MKTEDRIQAFIALSGLIGVNVTARLIRNTVEHYPQAGIPRIHHLIEGIYKQAADRYAFCVWSRSAAELIGKSIPIYFSPRPTVHGR